MARRKRKMQGKGPVLDWIKKAARSAHNFIKDNRLISRGATALAPIAGPYSSVLNRVGTVAGTAWLWNEETKTWKTKEK